jgi:hypothetical protein
MTYEKSSLTHSVAPPFQIEPAALGFDLVLGRDLKDSAAFLSTKDMVSVLIVSEEL